MGRTSLAVSLAVVMVVLSTAPRAMLAAGVLPDAARPFIWSDVYATYIRLLDGGKLPYFETTFDYPPVIGYLAGLFARIADGPIAYVLMWGALAAAAAGAVAFVIAREVGPQQAIRYWSLSPQLVLYGGANFDLIPVVLLVSAMALARRDRSLASLAVLAVGAAAKLFPAVAAPIEVERIRRRRGTAAAVLGAAVFAVVVAAVVVPSLMAAHPSSEGILLQGQRTNFDSIWGLVLAAASAAGLPEAGPVVGWISLAGVAGTYVLVIRRSDPTADPGRLALLGLLALLLWTRLYSPQYSLWLVPFCALLAIPRRLFMLLCVADVVVFATVYPLTLLRWESVDPIPTVLFGLLAMGIVLRHVALISMWRWAR